MEYPMCHLYVVGIHTSLCHRNYQISTGIKSQRIMGRLGIIPMVFLHSDWLYFQWHGVDRLMGSVLTLSIMNMHVTGEIHSLA